MRQLEYTKLTPVRQRGGIAVVSASRSNLWLGKDHLLSLETEGYTESYKRFYFRDIQAITLRKTVRMLVLGIISGFLGSVFALIAIFADANATKFTFGIFAGVCAMPFVLNLILGPTCACQLRTAVQTEDVPSLGRIRRARKVIARLRPLIAEAQGELNAEQIPQLMQELATGAAAAARSIVPDQYAPPVISRSAAGRMPEPLRAYRGRAHLMLFGLLLADLPLTLPHFFVQAGWLDTIGLLMMLATVGVAIWAIVKQQRTDLPRNLKLIPWISLGAMGLSLLIGMGYGVFLGISNPDALENLSPMTDPFFLGLTVITTTLSVILGTLGLMWLQHFRSRAAMTPKPPLDGSVTG